MGPKFQYLQVCSNDTSLQSTMRSPGLERICSSFFKYHQRVPPSQDPLDFEQCFPDHPRRMNLEKHETSLWSWIRRKYSSSICTQSHQESKLFLGTFLDQVYSPTLSGSQLCKKLCTIPYAPSWADLNFFYYFLFLAQVQKWNIKFTWKIQMLSR